ncbi:IclR family transcriptional regulator [uncultured Gemmiger sp.]|uniref:IclR family transcriptional regulator n=1 Tax=uncultured Gemmiger sp. TaxID=1623490 RepID=UPI0025E682CD|nr:IclR family transcriptional regulator [uncultured Gemmiger sp.]
MAEKSGVQSVERIFQLIESLAAHPAGAGLQRLAQDTDLAKSTVHRLLASLVSLGYAAQDENGRYRLTLKMFELSSGIVNSMDIMDVAKVHLERLAQRTGEAVHLVIRDGQDIVYIYKTESGPMRMSSRVGLRSPLYCTGVGKAILATLPADEVTNIWQHTTPQKLTAHTIVEFDALQAQLAEVRTNGYAIDDEENELGVRCVAVAIPGVGGRADSAFSISGLAPYMTPERIRRIATLAQDARTDIMADLGLAKRI